MTIFNVVSAENVCLHLGLATDTKPVSPNGFFFYEMDTDRVFSRENGAWVEKLSPSYLQASGTHASTHASGGADPLKLNNLAAPDGDVNFNDQEAVRFCLEKRISDPSTPTDGQIWLRTDL